MTQKLKYKAIINGEEIFFEKRADDKIMPKKIRINTEFQKFLLNR